MEIIKTIRIKSSPDNIFNLYQDITSWLVWDPEVSSVDIPNGLTIGAKGILKPKKVQKHLLKLLRLLKENHLLFQANYLFVTCYLSMN